METAKSSAHIVDKLATMIGIAVKNPVNPLHLHYVFESLCVLIRQVSNIYVYLFIDFRRIGFLKEIILIYSEK